MQTHKHKNEHPNTHSHKLHTHTHTCTNTYERIHKMTHTGITSAYVHKQMSVSEGGSKGRNKTESTRESEFVQKRERER